MQSASAHQHACGIEHVNEAEYQWDRDAEDQRVAQPVDERVSRSPLRNAGAAAKSPSSQSAAGKPDT